MTWLHLVLLAWGLAIVGICLLVHGAKLNDGGHKERMNAERRKEWITRMDVERVQ